MDISIIAPIAGNRRVSDTVYLIKCEQYFKVGVTWDLQQRLTDMQTGNPFKLQLVDYFQSSDAFKDEKALHLYLRKYHHHGEWFQLPMRLIKSRADWFFTTSPPIENISILDKKEPTQLSLWDPKESHLMGKGCYQSKELNEKLLQKHYSKVLEISKIRGWIKPSDVSRSMRRACKDASTARDWFKALEAMGKGELRGEGHYLRFKATGDIESDSEPIENTIEELNGSLYQLVRLSEKLGWVKAGDLIRTRFRKGLDCNQIREWFKYLESEGVGELRGEGRKLEFKVFPCAD